MSFRMNLKSVLSPVRYRTEASAQYKIFYKNTTCVEFDLYRHVVNNIRVDNFYNLIDVIKDKFYAIDLGI